VRNVTVLTQTTNGKMQNAQHKSWKGAPPRKKEKGKVRIFLKLALCFVCCTMAKLNYRNKK
jgi:hypothetical protein